MPSADSQRSASELAADVRGAFDRINEVEYPAYQFVVEPALAALDALVARVTDLEAQLDEARGEAGIWQDSSGAYRERMVAAEAQVAALTREANRRAVKINLAEARAEAAEAALATTRQALADIKLNTDDDTVRDIARRALTAADNNTTEPA